MMKSVIFLLVLVAVVNSDEEGNFLAAGDEGEGNFLTAGDEGEGNFLAAGDEGEGNFLTAGDEGEGNFLAAGDEGEGNFLAAGDVGEGNFLAAGDVGEGNFLAAGDEGEGELIADSDGDYFTVTRDVIMDPISSLETELPSSLARSNLNVGSICSSCRLLFSAQPRLAAIAGNVRIQNVRFYRAGVRISAVRVIRVGNSPRANPRIVAGGINSNTVTVRFTSGRGQRFHYTMQVWGR